MAATVTQILERARENYARILILVTQIVADTTSNAELTEPTRAQIDAVVTAANTAGIMRPTPDYSVGNRSVQWTAYQQFILAQIEKLDTLIQQRSGPYELKTHGRV